jgi:hypothetical protein
VKVIDLREGDSIASVTAVPKTEEEEAEVTAVEATEGAAEAPQVAETTTESNE